MRPFLRGVTGILSDSVFGIKENRKMNESQSNPVDRRVFLQVGVAATAATVGLVSSAGA